ncbi:MAG: RNA methyltransferase [Bacteroidales bacterium]|jgi:TrmH family RNA methyltransferase|nr:RNA methyltransferase [Bacteroidales bacterium]NLB85678.1 RNA methyltransferase [Bacteroidales bacterium]
MINKILSPNNKFIKEVLSLQLKSKERKKTGKFPIEGIKEISFAIKFNVIVEKILFCPEIISLKSVKELIGTEYDSAVKYELSREAFSKISYRESTGGVVVIAKAVYNSLEDIKVKDKSLFIILESVEKPGNLGSIVRIADAAKIDAVIICDQLTDIYNPNVIRASLGCVFSVKIVNSDTENVLKWIKENNIVSYAAELNSSEFYHSCNFSNPSAIAFGTEAFGLSQKWIDSADKRIKIPMLGNIDSLNVANSVAIIVYEARRQLNFLV